VHELLQQTLVKAGFVGYVTPGKENKHKNSLGIIEQLQEIIKIHKIDELIFCAKDIPAQTIIHYMGITAIGNVDYKIAPPESLSIIGSNSIDTSGELYTLDINAINKPSNLRSKRLLDILVSLLFILSLPLSIWWTKDKIGFFRNLFLVFGGRKTWVGYHTTFPGISVEELPELRTAVLHPSDIHASSTLNTETIRQLNLLYAKDYKISADISIILRGFRNLGRN
jgi:O-antigen biosynthesis protein